MPKSEALELLKGYVAEVIEELKGHREYVEDVAVRNLDLDARQARVDLTPDGHRLTNYILGSDRGCLAALRRLEIRQKPDRPAPKRRPRKPEAAAAASPQAEPEPEPKPQDDPGSSTAQAGADISTVEAISEPATAEPGADLLTVEAISEPAAGRARADLLTVEAISEPATAEPGAGFLTVEAISEPATAEPGADLLTVEAISNDPAAEDDLERFGPEADHLRQVRLDLEAIYGAGRPIDGAAGSGRRSRPGTDPGHARRESPALRAAEQFTRRQWELSRRLDAHFGINGDRPDPAGPAPVSERVEDVPRDPLPGLPGASVTAARWATACWSRRRARPSCSTLRKRVAGSLTGPRPDFGPEFTPTYSQFGRVRAVRSDTPVPPFVRGGVRTSGHPSSFPSL